jgi:predicted nicotinamide N-methyase
VTRDEAARKESTALRRELERRFRTSTRTVQLGGLDVDLLSPANADDLISEDDYVMDERLPYWADLWPSAQVLAGEVRTLRLRGQRVLELGCGLGLVAIGAALAGAEVTATDYYEDALLFAKLNVLDASGRAIATRMVNWVDMPADLGRFDVVLASDVLYEHRYAPLVADPGRIALDAFLDECRERGLAATSDQREWREGEIRQTVTLWRLRWNTD